MTKSTMDWAVVGLTIRTRVAELGWPPGELARRSGISPGTVREIQLHSVERRRSFRTLRSLSAALGYHPDHLDAVALGQQPPEIQQLIDDAVLRRLDTLSGHLAGLIDRLTAWMAAHDG
ncbi:helix-turn-helix domain-containing protein [Actinokineospora enzanensis]|uniref:helix-turn-helix domain-containing protein n=1 Tax=Actinokineospora enzanensis TaxID=155975 RepID=UPI000476C28A|nr:helix-turn-helix transcriptional regulator [Actinokineospora enzanensis]